MEAKVHKHLSSFLAQHSLQDSVCNIDEIVLSYLLGVLDLISQGEVEDCFDLEDVMDMMNAYLPGFDQINRSSVMDWMFSLAAQLKNLEMTENNTSQNNEQSHQEEVSQEKHDEELPQPRKSSFPNYDYNSSGIAQNEYVNEETIVNGKNKKEQIPSTETDTQGKSFPKENIEETTKTLPISENHAVMPLQSHPKEQKMCKRKKRYISCSSQESQEDSSTSKSQIEIQADLDDCLIRNLLDMFPATCSMEAKHCLHVSNGDMNAAAQLIMDRQDSGQAITENQAKSVKNTRKTKKVSDVKLDDASIKSCVIEKYSFYDVAEEERTHKPPPLKNEAKKLVRYRDGQIVSMKGERFSEIKKS